MSLTPTLAYLGARVFSGQRDMTRLELPEGRNGNDALGLDNTSEAIAESVGNVTGFADQPVVPLAGRKEPSRRSVLMSSM